MPDLNYPLNIPDSYIRVQTNYYKKCLQPTIHREYKEIWMPWSAEMLKQDLTKSAFRKIPKFDGFSCVPQPPQLPGNYR